MGRERPHEKDIDEGGNEEERERERKRKKEKKREKKKKEKKGQHFDVVQEAAVAQRKKLTLPQDETAP